MSAVEFKVDMTGFQNAMKTYMRESGKTAKQVLIAQAQKLVSSSFGASRGGLYQEARKEAPKTKAEIRGLRARYGYRIKRAPGVTVAQEIKRRLRFAGYVQSTGWLNRVWNSKGTDTKTVMKPRGKVVQQLSGNNMSITLINDTPGAAKFANKTGYVRRAVANREQDMAKYVKRKMLEAARRSGLKVA